MLECKLMVFLLQESEFGIMNFKEEWKELQQEETSAWSLALVNTHTENVKGSLYDFKARVLECSIIAGLLAAFLFTIVVIRASKLFIRDVILFHVNYGFNLKAHDKEFKVPQFDVLDNQATHNKILTSTYVKLWWKDDVRMTIYSSFISLHIEIQFRDCNEGRKTHFCISFDILIRFLMDW